MPFRPGLFSIFFAVCRCFQHIFSCFRNPLSFLAICDVENVVLPHKQNYDFKLLIYKQYINIFSEDFCRYQKKSVRELDGWIVAEKVLYFLMSAAAVFYFGWLLEVFFFSVFLQDSIRC